MKAAIRFVIYLALCACAPAITLAQLPPIAQPPAPIELPEWQLTGSFEFYDRYEVRLPSDVITEHPVNNSFQLMAFLPTDTPGPHPMVLILHYLGASDLGLESRLAARLAARGIAAAVIELPYHMSRTPPGYTSGELSVRPDVDALKLGTVQSVRDARRAIDFMVAQPEIDPTRVSISGSSLGSIIAAAVFGVDSRVDAGSFLLGGVDMAHIIWSSSKTAPQREELREKGYDEQSLRAALVDVEPAQFIAPDERSALVIGARYDTVIPPEDTRKLIAQLHSPSVIWLDTGHYGPALIEDSVLGAVVRFFESEYFGAGFVAEIRSAPTLRIGVQYTDALDMQIVLGLDVWRSNKRGDFFLSIMLAPDEIQAWFGAKLGGHLSVGLSFQPKRIAPGILWSIVL